MFKWEILRFKTLVNLKRQVFHWNLWNEKTCQWHCSTKAKLLKINFNCICQNKVVNVHGLSKVQCLIQIKRVLILWGY